MIVGGLLKGLMHRLTGRGTADNGEAAVGYFCFELGSHYWDTLTLVSPSSFRMVFFQRDAIFTRSYLRNPTRNFSSCFQYTLNQRSVSQRCH